MTRRRARRLAIAALVATAVLLAVGGVIYATGSEFADTDVLDAGLSAAVMLGMCLWTRPRSASIWLSPVTIPERPSGRKEA